MIDRRWMQLADLLVTHSTGVKPGERNLWRKLTYRNKAPLINSSGVQRSLFLFLFARTNAQRHPLFLIFQAVLDSAPVMGLIESFWLNEHLLAFE